MGYSELFIFLGLSLNIITFVIALLPEGKHKLNTNSNYTFRLNKSTAFFTFALTIGLGLQVIGALINSI